MGVYHSGEIAVQERAGVRQMSVRVAGGIHDFLPPAAAEFLATQRFVVGSISDAAGNIWAVPIPGPLSLSLSLRDERHVAVPDNLCGAVGLVVMDFATRRRMRLNGIARDGVLTIAECYANCPKYIQKREGERGVFSTASVPFPVPEGSLLTDEQRTAIHYADTFFIATRCGDASADASHRGGNPGFVHAPDRRTLEWRDYSGNAMFNTLGNLQADGRAGLFFPDFQTGNALLLSGTAEIIWNTPDERTVRFTVRQVARQSGVLRPTPNDDVQYSPFNPLEQR